MTPDRQLVAFAGKPDGSIELVDNRQPPGHTNQMLRQAGNYAPISHDVGDIRFPNGEWSDALKVSGCINLSVRAGVVEGGTEDVLDVNHSQKCAVSIEEAYPRGKYVLTCKGASQDITVTVRRQHGHGKEVDYDLGNHSDQGNGTTRNTGISANAFGEQISVRVLRSDKPRLDGGPFRWAFPRPDAWYHPIVIRILNLVQ